MYANANNNKVRFNAFIEIYTFKTATYRTNNKKLQKLRNISVMYARHGNQLNSALVNLLVLLFYRDTMS